MYLVYILALKLEDTVGLVSESMKCKSTMWCWKAPYFPEHTGECGMYQSWFPCPQTACGDSSLTLYLHKWSRIDTGNLRGLDLPVCQWVPRSPCGDLVWILTILQPATQPPLLFITSLKRTIAFTITLIEASMWHEPEIWKYIVYSENRPYSKDSNRPYLGFMQSSFVLLRLACGNEPDSGGHLLDFCFVFLITCRPTLL